MLVGLDEGVYTASWMMYVTDGNSAYYNIQEDVSRRPPHRSNDWSGMGI